MALTLHLSQYSCHGGERVPFLFTIKELQAKVHPFCVIRWHLVTE